jgi:hypothetical protein
MRSRQAVTAAAGSPTSSSPRHGQQMMDVLLPF